nr:HYR domain-containing protein [Peribacillus simplex]
MQVKGTGGSGVLNNVIAIAAGEFHSLALLNDGTVRAWGNNESGQLGDGTNIDSNVPVQVKGTGGSGALNNVVAIAAGGFHSLALLNDGTVRAWGNNESGQLGDGINTDSDIPVTVSGLTNSNIIAGGGDHSLDIQLPPPTIICPANITVSNDPMECGAVVVYPDSIVSDDCPAGFTAVCVPASGTFFPVGTTTVTCTVTDPCGGFAECSFTVTVNDTEPPTITCSDDVAVTVGPGETGAFVTFPNPVVTDNCPSVMFSCTPVSGTFFPVGSTLVTCTATDTAGNAATCSFTVTVTVESIELQCILVQKVYDWVVLTNRDLNKVLIPEECFTLIENCRREGGVVTATCAEVEGTRRCDVLPGPRPAPNVPDGRIVTISFHVRIRIEFFCEGVPLCSFDVPVNFLDDVILCFPQGTDINCTIFDVQCKVLLNEVLGNVVMLEVVMCKDVQVEAEVKIEVEAKFCGPRQPIPIEEQLTVCTFPTFPQQCPDIFPI